VAQLVEALHDKPEGRGLDSLWGHWDFSLSYFLRPLCGPGIVSVSNADKDQGYLLGVKAAGTYGLDP
jgi:hypothetical protein